MNKKIESIKQSATYFSQFSIWEILLIFFILTTYFFIFISLQYLPIYDIFINNGDILLIEYVARSLNAGSDLLSWRLTQAPYLFPDIFIARILAALNLPAGQIAIYYHAIFGIIALTLISWLCKLSKISATTPILFAALVYSFSYYGLLSSDIISVYFGLIGNHSGNIIPTLLCIISTILFFQNKSLEAPIFLLLFSSLFLGTISDSLIILAFIPFTTLFILLCLIKKEETLPRTLAFFSVMLSAIILGKMYSFITPFAQDRDFFKFIIARLSSSTVELSVKLFARDFVYYFFKSYISALIAVMFFSSFTLSLIQLISVMRTKNTFKTPVIFLSLFVIISPLIVIFTQIGLGIYGSASHSRQWSPLIYLAIVFGIIILLNKFESKKWIVQASITVLAALLLILLTKALSHNRGVTRDNNVFSSFIACMKENHLPTGAYYMSDYWPEIPIRLYSNNEFLVIAANRFFDIWTPGSDVAQDRKISPKFIITGYDIDEKNVIKKLGSPEKIYCRMDIAGNKMSILDYSHNEKVKAFLKEKAMKSN